MKKIYIVKIEVFAHVRQLFADIGTKNSLSLPGCIMNASWNSGWSWSQMSSDLWDPASAMVCTGQGSAQYSNSLNMFSHLCAF